MSENTESIRLDIWLWRARFFKTRKLAHEFITKRGFRVTRHSATRKVKKPATSIIAGDQLAWVRDGDLHTITVLALGERRGPASEAQMLYKRIEVDGYKKAG